jgi:hypothetical protein
MVAAVSRIGETSTSNNGQLMTIINYRKSNDIDVQFEDGSIVMHRTYLCFRKGRIANPNFNPYATKFVGQTHKSNGGQLMTIVAYRTADDIDVKFSDGTVVEHRQMVDFNSGTIKNPNFYQHRIGQVSQTADGQTMKIVAYRSSKDIDVQFDDGTIIEHRNYVAFVRGLIHNPNCTHHVSQRVCRTGLSKLTHKGLILTISAYRKYKHVDYIFDTGYEVKHRTFEDFEKGKIKHPFPYMIGTVSMDKPAYIHNNIGNFYCHCTKCNIKDILTVEEIKNHICINE